MGNIRRENHENLLLEKDKFGNYLRCGACFLVLRGGKPSLMGDEVIFKYKFHDKVINTIPCFWF